MFCRYCGVNIPDDSLFCSKCGRSLGQPENPRTDSPVQPEKPRAETRGQHEHARTENYVQREHPETEHHGQREHSPLEGLGLLDHPYIETYAEREPSRIERLVKVLRLNTPYPYAGILVLLAVVWVNYPRKSTYDYSQLKWSIEKDSESDVPDDHLYRDSLSLVIENTGTKSIKGIPIEIHARIEPKKTAEVEATFGSNRETVIAAGKPQPVALVLGDTILAEGKRRYSFEESVRAKQPFKVILEIRENDARTVLTQYTLER